MPDQTPREQLAAGIETWVNRDWLVLPGPVDMGPELVEHLAKKFEGWRPPARVITTVAELDELPIGSVILLEYGVVAQAVGGEEDITATGWMGIGHDLQWTSAQVVEHAGQGASFTVLYVPKNWSMTWCMCGHHERWHAEGPCTFHSDTEQCRCRSMEPHPENGGIE